MVGLLYYFNHQPRNAQLDQHANCVVPLDNTNVTPDVDGVTIHITSRMGVGEGVTVSKRNKVGQQSKLKSKKISLRAGSRHDRDRWVQWMHGTATLLPPDEADMDQSGYFDDNESIGVAPSVDYFDEEERSARMPRRSSFSQMGADVMHFLRRNIMEEIQTKASIRMRSPSMRSSSISFSSREEHVRHQFTTETIEGHSRDVDHPRVVQSRDFIKALVPESPVAPPGEPTQTPADDYSPFRK